MTDMLEYEELDLAKAGSSAASETAASAGPLRYIIRSAHKWGGNGTVPDFDKIKRVLTTRHPDVIARAFGGDANRAAAWIKDAWERMHGRVNKGKGPTYWRGKSKSGHSTENDATMSDDFEYDDPMLEVLFSAAPAGTLEMLEEQGVEHELFCASGHAVEKDGLVYKVAARTGTWQLSPIPGGKPLVLDEGMLTDVAAAFREGAVPHVTVPLEHPTGKTAHERALYELRHNTGFVKDVQVRPDPVRPGEHVLVTGIDFKDAGVKQKALEGSIADCSVCIGLGGARRTSDGRFFPRVLKHVALTQKPWLDGLQPFGSELAASVACYELDEDDVDVMLSMHALVLAMEGPDETESGKTTRRNQQEESGENDAPPARANYRTAATPARSCKNCQHFDAGHCDLYNCPVEGGMVSNGFRAQTDANASTLEMELGWLPASVKESELDDGDFAVVYKDGDTKVRKLPYKVHGAVNEAGWRAAWSMAAKTHLPSGVSLDSVRKKLLASKPKGVDVSAGAVLRVRSTPVVLRLSAFDEAKHPRGPKGTPGGGEFIARLLRGSITHSTTQQTKGVRVHVLDHSTGDRFILERTGGQTPKHRVDYRVTAHSISGNEHAASPLEDHQLSYEQGKAMDEKVIEHAQRMKQKFPGGQAPITNPTRGTTAGAVLGRISRSGRDVRTRRTHPGAAQSPSGPPRHSGDEPSTAERAKQRIAALRGVTGVTEGQLNDLAAQRFGSGTFSEGDWVTTPDGDGEITGLVTRTNALGKTERRYIVVMHGMGPPRHSEYTADELKHQE